MFEDKKKKWLKTAESLKPVLIRETVQPVSGLPEQALSENESVILDFGNHFVGKLTLRLSSKGSHPDAPAWLRIKFCENERELSESAEEYHGWISKGWIQQEYIHADVLPAVVSLPRRYAFRYVKIDILALSTKFQLVIENASAETTTCADDSAIVPLPCEGLDGKIDRIALRTLRNCMQDFFEDGPKRDRRLWMGDLRLQALTNSVSYRNFDLVKRCLYLFAGTVNNEGRIAACLFTEPEIEADDTCMFDYSLFFIPALLNYGQCSGDEETVRDLLPAALQQLVLAEPAFDPETQLIREFPDPRFCFVDWNLELNKQVSSHAIWIYCAEAAQQLQYSPDLETKIRIRRDAAKRNWYDAQKHLFLSGGQKQISWASQVWAVLAGIITRDEAARCLKASAETENIVGMVTPYMMHHYAEALCKIGKKAEARQIIRDYWGAMAEAGADTFWELFNPQNPNESPYGSPIVNSYCHAWSCTPSWFYRSGILEDEK